MVRCINILPILLFSLLIAQRAGSSGQQQLAGHRTAQQIQAILDSISAENIHSYLDTLIGFTFRHTMDDTTSATTGIGAARRWVLRKFQEFSTASGGTLQPQYFDFTATICGISRLHRNVMAIQPGTLTPDRYFIVSGHLDTRGHPTDPCAYGIFSPGATDDASGTAISIELARVMSRYQFDASIIYMAVVGEDEGLFGSEAYAAFADGINLRIDGMITNDVVGNIVGQNGVTDSTSIRHFSSVADATPHRQMSRYMKLTSEFYYPLMTVNLIPAQDRPGRGGDHQSFQNHGYTAVRFTEPNENFANQHTATDIVANISPPYVARVARVNAAGLASLAWAPQSPAQPTIVDQGTGTTLLVQWPGAPTEPDFWGYRIAVRDSGGLFYTSVVDAGNVHQYTISGLTPGISVYIGVSAYDTSGNESIFSTETLARPTNIPTAPANFASTSFLSQVQLVWDPNAQLDIVRYRLYRSTSRTAGFAPFDSVAAPATQYTDTGVAINTLYFYQVRAVDTEGNESPASATIAGRRVTHDGSILVIDGTRDGAGSATAPTDAAVDTFYQALLGDFAVSGEWDVADSLLTSIHISDAEMGRFSTIVWHTDVRTSAPLYADTMEIREYLQQGGHLFLGGWKLSSSLKSNAVPGPNAYTPGSFVPAFLKVDSMLTSGPFAVDFASAIALAPGYGNTVVDSAKTPTGGLVNTDVALPPFAGSGAEAIFSHHTRLASSTLEGKPVGWRYVGADFKLVVFEFPLYYMKQQQAKAALRQALIDLGEPLLGVADGGPGLPGKFDLYQNYPNPFNPTTRIRFDVPLRSTVTIVIFDVLGREVRTLIQEEKPAGSHFVSWNGMNDQGRSVASGIYFYRLFGTSNEGSYLVSKKMVYVR